MRLIVAVVLLCIILKYKFVTWRRSSGSIPLVRKRKRVIRQSLRCTWKRWSHSSVSNISSPTHRCVTFQHTIKLTVCHIPLDSLCSWISSLHVRIRILMKFNKCILHSVRMDAKYIPSFKCEMKNPLNIQWNHHMERWAVDNSSSIFLRDMARFTLWHLRHRQRVSADDNWAIYMFYPGMIESPILNTLLWPISLEYMYELTFLYGFMPISLSLWDSQNFIQFSVHLMVKFEQVSRIMH